MYLQQLASMVTKWRWLVEGLKIIGINVANYLSLTMHSEAMSTPVHPQKIKHAQYFSSGCRPCNSLGFDCIRSHSRGLSVGTRRGQQWHGSVEDKNNLAWPGRQNKDLCGQVENFTFVTRHESWNFRHESWKMAARRADFSL